MPPPSLVELQVEDVGVALLGHRRDLRQVRAHLVGERVEGLEVGGEREGPEARFRSNNFGLTFGLRFGLRFSTMEQVKKWVV